jgi:hypothetical protein
MSDPQNPEDWRQLLRNAFALRAAAYAEFYRAMSEALGPDEALRVGKIATRRLGEAIGSRFTPLAPGDLAGLRDAFLDSIPDRDALFGPEVVRCDASALEIQFHRCPLKAAWEAQGIAGDQLGRLCAMAGAIDGGLFDSAGFKFEGTTWQPGQSGCCRLRVVPGPDPAAVTRREKR